MYSASGFWSMARYGCEFTIVWNNLTTDGADQLPHLRRRRCKQQNTPRSISVNRDRLRDAREGFRASRAARSASRRLKAALRRGVDAITAGEPYVSMCASPPWVRAPSPPGTALPSAEIGGAGAEVESFRATAGASGQPERSPRHAGVARISAAAMPAARSTRPCAPRSPARCWGTFSCPPIWSGLDTVSEARPAGRRLAPERRSLRIWTSCERRRAWRQRRTRCRSSRGSATTPPSLSCRTTPSRMPVRARASCAVGRRAKARIG